MALRQPLADGQEGGGQDAGCDVGRVQAARPPHTIDEGGILGLLAGRSPSPVAVPAVSANRKRTTVAMPMTARTALPDGADDEADAPLGVEGFGDPVSGQKYRPVDDKTKDEVRIVFGTEPCIDGR